MTRVIRRIAWPLALGLTFFALTEQVYEVARHTADESPAVLGTRWVFQGYLHFPEDNDTYAALAGQAARGAWLLPNPYYARSQTAAYPNWMWIGVGKLQGWMGVSFADAFMALRLFGCVLLAYALVRLARVIAHSADVPTADAAAKPTDTDWGPLIGFPLLAFVCTGFGIIALVDPGMPAPEDMPPHVAAIYPALEAWSAFVRAAFGIAAGIALPDQGLMLPPDLQTEMTPFLAAFLVPHAALAHALLILALIIAFEAVRDGRAEGRIVAGVLAGLLTLARTYDGLTALLGLGLLYGVEVMTRFPTAKAHARATGLGLGIAAAAMAYMVLLFTINPAFALWSQGNVYPPPPLKSMLLALGWAGVGAGLTVVVGLLGGIVWLFRRGAKLPWSAGGIFLTGWLGLHFTLLYTGLPFAWRTVGATFVVALALAAVGLRAFLKPWATRPVWRVAILVPLLVGVTTTSLPVSAFITLNALEYAAAIDPDGDRYFLEADVIDAMGWMDRNLRPHALVLTHGYYSLKLPAYARVRPLLGHKDMAGDQLLAKSVYGGISHEPDPAKAQEWLRKMPVEYVMWGPIDEKWAREDPSRIPALAEVYRSKITRVFEVRPELWRGPRVSLEDMPPPGEPVRASGRSVPPEEDRPPPPESVPKVGSDTPPTVGPADSPPAPTPPLPPSVP